MLKRTRIERILEPFGAHHSAGLIDFFNLISDSNFDAIIFMARKAVCLYHMMELCGIKKPKGRVYSSAILDGEHSQLKDKTILVVDDTLFIGTTLQDTKVELNRLNVKSVEYWVYSEDADSPKDNKFSPDYVHISEGSQEILEFCAAECRALINAGIPYLTDFAATKRITFTPKELDYAIKPFNWYFYDISSQFHENSKVKYYSGLPDQFVNEMIKNVLGKQLFSIIEIAKIRIFSTWSGRYYDTTIVPVVTFGNLNEPDVKKYVIALFSIFNLNIDLLNNGKTSDFVRIMQFLVGALYLKNYYTYLKSIKNFPITKMLNNFWCTSSFPDELSKEISEGIGNYYSNNEIKKSSQLAIISSKEPIAVVSETRNDISHFLDGYFSKEIASDFIDTPLSDLTAIFLKFHEKFEHAAIKEVVEKKEKPKHRNRLKRGMAWVALSEFMLNKHKIEDTKYKRNILSLYLDRLIDYGIAVPILVTVDNQVYRAYRHGEDVKFGAQEENLIFQTMAGFEKGRGNKGFERTYFEKMIVILLRVGMKEEWLNLWYSRSGNDTLMRVGYHLQGAIPIVPHNNDDLLPEGESSWITQRLCKTETVIEHITGNNKTYHLGNEPQAAHARRDASRTASSLGFTLGRACVSKKSKRSPERPLGTEDLIILTSCSNLMDTVGSVSCELVLFSQWYTNIGQKFLLNTSKANNINTVRGSKGEEALNSGRWKIEQFENNAIDAIKKKVEYLEHVDETWPMLEKYWDAVFEAFNRIPSLADKKKLTKALKINKNRVAEGLLYLKILELVFLDRKKLLHAKPAIKIKNSLIGKCENLFIDEYCTFLLCNLIESKVNDLSRDDNILLSNEVNKMILSYIQTSNQEASFAMSLLSKADRNLSRKTYRFMVWYDILDVRVRKKETQYQIDEYTESIQLFRSHVSSILSDTSERIRATGGDIFVDTGEIRSLNDEKHIFISEEGSGREVISVSNSLIKAASQAGVNIRLIVTATNLRGEYVYLNKGETSIDGDFKSHLHTMAQEVHGHRLEGTLERGSSLLWLAGTMSQRFKDDSGSIEFSKHDSEKTIDVNIRGFNMETKLHPYICNCY